MCMFQCQIRRACCIRPAIPAAIPKVCSAHTLRTRDTFALQDQYKSLGEHVQAVKVEHMKSQLATFKSSLEQFAIKHR